MATQPRSFSCVDPFGVTWEVQFLWQQVGISIRHADTIDCKFLLSSESEQVERVLALPHPILKDFAKAQGREITDAWVLRLAGAHLKSMVESGDDMDKTLVTLSLADLERSQQTVSA